MELHDVDGCSCPRDQRMVGVVGGCSKMCCLFREGGQLSGYDSFKNYGLLQRRAAAVAQRIARWTSNSEVVGSSPISGVYKGVRTC